MYIEPNTNIRLLQNVPIDSGYQHTLHFASPSDQGQYFIAQQKYNLGEYSYQRVSKGIARVGINAMDLYDCNYMMFQNTSYGAKWFYAFITSVEFINNSCSEIHFEIDVMQTWYFNYVLDYCFVEREHSSTDEIGDNIIPETLECGEYVFNNYSPLVSMTDMCVVIAIVDTDNALMGSLYDGIYGAAILWVYNSTDTGLINAKLAEYNQKPDAIISMYMIPKRLIGDIPESHVIPYNATGSVTNVSKEAIHASDSLDGYVPKNNKLYTYPYNFYHIDNASGGSLSLRYEFFDNLKPELEITGTVTQPIQVVLRPTNYKGSGNGTLNTESLQLNSYPVCSWAVDSYQAWIAQSALPLALSTGASLAGSVITGIANPAAGVLSAAGTVGNVISQMYQASIAADITKGNFNNGGVNTASGRQQFYGGRCSVSHQYAKMIDDFFTMYGYAAKKVKIPNRSARPKWNYIKTIGCTITGSIPSDDVRRICAVYDNGITFWKKAVEVGNYSLDNSLGGE